MSLDKELSQLLRVAVVEHLRHWWARDSLWQHCLGPGRSKTDSAYKTGVVRQLAMEYNVGRGIRSGREGDVLSLLESRLDDWPPDLLARAEFVRETANIASDSDFTNGRQLSGFSKLFWFARPGGWTMFDRFAKQGLAARYRGADEFEAFYRKLSELGFDETMETCRQVIKGSKFPYLWPERILDKYLMFCGQQRNARGGVVIRDTDHGLLIEVWSKIHGTSVSRDIDDLVENLCKAVADKPLFQRHQRVANR